MYFGFVRTYEMYVRLYKLFCFFISILVHLEHQVKGMNFFFYI